MRKEYTVVLVDPHQVMYANGYIYLHVGAELDSCRDTVSWLLYSSCYQLLDVVLACASTQQRGKTQRKE